MTTPPPMETLTELKINDALKQKVMEAYVPNDWPIIVGYVDEQGRPGMSYRGSVVVVSETQLGMWARNAGGQHQRRPAEEPEPDAGLPRADAGPRTLRRRGHLPGQGTHRRRQ